MSTRSFRSSTGHWLRRVSGQPRVLLAVKTAGAAALAWYLAPLLPFADDKYAYYAPMGVIVSMYPTIASSLRAGWQSLAALAIGIALGLAVLIIPMPRVLGVVIVIAAGVLLAGLKFLGSSNNWVPLAAMFVLLIGGGNADDFSFNYIFNVLFGIVIGTIVNLAIAPPVPLNAAANRINQLRDRAAEHLSSLGESLGKGDHGREDWERSLRQLDSDAHDVRGAVHEADESRRGNFRGRRTADELKHDYDRLRALERVLFLTRDITDVVGLATNVHGGVEESSTLLVRVELATALARVADLVATPVGSEESPTRLADAEAAVLDLERSADAHVQLPSHARDASATALALRRIIEVARPFVADDDRERDAHEHDDREHHEHERNEQQRE